ncbi:hypothetical protein DAI22_02g247100 [Oryza sativa Japonica Group]|nr:hypothetical protein DAI22_02g247100 [Oryza sativa Japonica Group]
MSLTVSSAGGSPSRPALLRPPPPRRATVARSPPGRRRLLPSVTEAGRTRSGRRLQLSRRGLPPQPRARRPPLALLRRSPPGVQVAPLSSRPSQPARGKGKLLSVVVGPSVPPRRSPPELPVGAKEAGGWQVVRSKKNKQQRPSPPPPSPPRRPVPRDLNGCCFNCLIYGDVRKDCRSPPSCFGCGESGHHVGQCRNVRRPRQPPPRGRRQHGCQPAQVPAREGRRRSPPSRSPPHQRRRVWVVAGSATPPGATGPTPSPPPSAALPRRSLPRRPGRRCRPPSRRQAAPCGWPTPFRRARADPVFLGPRAKTYIKPLYIYIN